jgi:Ca2+-binding RTX toxin-like protein
VALGGGLDTIVLAESGNTVTVSNIETIAGGGGDDKITFTSAAVDVELDTFTGNDTITLSSQANSLTISNAETISGGTAVDFIIVDTEMNGGAISLGSGYDTATFTAGVTALFTAVETITTSSDDDSITLSATYTGATIDMGAGTDYLIFTSSGTVNVSNAEHITGGIGINKIILTGTGTTNIDVGSGDDIIMLSQGQDNVTTGGGADRLVYTSVDQSDASNVDVILDFTVGTDLLVFEGLLSGTFSYLGNSTSLSGTGDSEAYFVNATDRLHVDTDGDGNVDMVIKLSGLNYDDIDASEFNWSLP